MRHVDEGTIHAWLDEQVTEAGEAAWIEEHLRTCADCGARLASERAAFDRARGLLAAAAPAAEAPSFDSLVARSGGASAASRPASATGRASNGAVWLRAGWAASLALAAGLGWMARGLTGGEAASVLQESARLERGASVPRGETPAIAPPRQQADDLTGAPAVRDAGPGTGTPAVPRDTAARSQGAASTAVVERALPAPAAVPVEESARGAVGAAAAPPAAAPQAAAAAVSPEAPPRPPPVTEPARAAGDVAPSRPADTVQLRAAPRQETVAASAAAPIPAIPATGAEWRPVPRTEAAARTGMPLYGIDGLVPVLTSVSSGGDVVRTIYRLGSGGTVELMQARAAAGAASAERPAPPAAVESTARALSPSGRGGVLADRVVVPRTWSDVRGDARLTLTTSGAADLDDLGARLRVD